MTSPALAPIAAGIISPDLLRALAATNRTALENMIEVGIGILDEIDGDPDDQDGNGAEDDECAWFGRPGWLRERGENLAGCPVADPGGEGDWQWPHNDKAKCTPLFGKRG